MSWYWLHPGWLVASLATLLPILIHLWGRGRGREIVVASLRWFPDGPSHTARRWQPRDPWLLLARCLSLLCLALALAGPRALVPPRATAATWILVEPTAVAVPEGRERLAELRRSEPGAEVRWFLPEAPSFGAGVEVPPAATDWIDDQWGVLRAIDAAAPPGVELVLLTSDRSVALPGSRPEVGRSVRWVTVPLHQPQEWAVLPAQPVARRVSTSAHTLGISAEPAVGRRPWSVELVAPADRSVGRDLLSRAIRSIAARGWPVTLAAAADTTPAPSASLVLGADSLPAAGVRWQLRESDGLERSCRGSVLPTTLRLSFSVTRCLEAPAGEVVWRAPDGAPLLTRSVVPPEGAGPPRIRYLLASRVAPDWLQLDAVGWADWLEARWRLDGLLPTEVVPPGRDRRLAFAGEQRPRTTAAGVPSTPRPRRWPESLLWGLTGALLLAERILQRRRG